jgi:hypothetical protein
MEEARKPEMIALLRRGKDAANENNKNWVI